MLALQEPKNLALEIKLDFLGMFLPPSLFYQEEPHVDQSASLTVKIHLIFFRWIL